jgi:hypothetical protein
MNKGVHNQTAVTTDVVTFLFLDQTKEKNSKVVLHFSLIDRTVLFPLLYCTVARRGKFGQGHYTLKLLFILPVDPRRRPVRSIQVSSTSESEIDATDIRTLAYLAKRLDR